jgi:pimeloyl-ACP methyl ester carboxylesterase
MPVTPPSHEERERSVAVAEGVRLHVVERGPVAGAPGARRPVLLVHGLASNARLWDGVARSLAASGHPVVAVDQRGHGRSDTPDSGYDMATVTADLAALVAALGWARPVVAGQSWGGNVVLELAARHPHSVSAVAAVDGGFIELSRRFHTWDECAAVLRPPHLEGTPAVRMEQWMREAHTDWPEEGIQGALANFEVRPDGTIRPWLSLERHMMILRELYAHKPLLTAPRIECPVLLVPADTGDVAWTHDKEEAVAELLGALPDGRVHWFRPAHHDVHAQHPAEVAAVLSRLAEETDHR